MLGRFYINLIEINANGEQASTAPLTNDTNSTADHSRNSISEPVQRSGSGKVRVKVKVKKEKHPEDYLDDMSEYT